MSKLAKGWGPCRLLAAPHAMKGDLCSITQYAIPGRPRQEGHSTSLSQSRKGGVAEESPKGDTSFPPSPSTTRPQTQRAQKKRERWDQLRLLQANATAKPLTFNTVWACRVPRQALPRSEAGGTWRDWREVGARRRALPLEGWGPSGFG